MYRRFIRPLFFARRFYFAMVVIIVLFIISYSLSWLFLLAQLVLASFAVLVVLDYMILFFRKRDISAQRHVPDRFSNGDENKISLRITNHYPFRANTKIIDEMPEQLQQRNFVLHATMSGGEAQELPYSVRPGERGEYVFHDIHVFVRSPLGLVIRRITVKAEQMVKVLPSFLMLRQFELLAHSTNLAEAGNKRIRKIGHSLEFEQIKEYVTGDDIRSINWKATARKGGQLMVNNYTDERSQHVYCVIDKGRVMKMPFEGMTLLDYSINAALMLCRVALIRQDKAGLISFADQVGHFLPADRKAGQMAHILDMLYNERTNFLETDFEKLHVLLRTRVTQRSFIVLFTNFESLYVKTIAEKFAYEKKLIVKELQQHGIFTILTAPEHLTVNTVNKYLELKARRAI